MQTPATIRVSGPQDLVTIQAMAVLFLAKLGNAEAHSASACVGCAIECL